jgi:hypothetical protein
MNIIKIWNLNTYNELYPIFFLHFDFPSSGSGQAAQCDEIRISGFCTSTSLSVTRSGFLVSGFWFQTCTYVGNHCFTCFTMLILRSFLLAIGIIARNLDFKNVRFYPVRNIALCLLANRYRNYLQILRIMPLKINT